MWPTFADCVLGLCHLHAYLLLTRSFDLQHLEAQMLLCNKGKRPCVIEVKGTKQSGNVDEDAALSVSIRPNLGPCPMFLLDSRQKICMIFHLAEIVLSTPRNTWNYIFMRRGILWRHWGVRDPLSKYGRPVFCLCSAEPSARFPGTSGRLPGVQTTFCIFSWNKRLVQTPAPWDFYDISALVFIFINTLFRESWWGFPDNQTCKLLSESKWFWESSQHGVHWLGEI